VRFLCDENVDQQIVDELRRTGHEVTYIAETETSIDDDWILDNANRQGATLVTSDRDFGELVFRQRRISGGVLLVRLGRFTPEKRAEIVAQAVRDHGKEMIDVFTVISPGLIRDRRRPES
jgi:predicted nuclease of predicted toxin-antitoxin system